MSENNKKNNDNRNENDPYDFFKLDPGTGGNNNDKKTPDGKKKMPFWGLLLIILGILVAVNLLFTDKDEGKEIPFSEFRSKILSNEIVEIELGENVFTGYTADGVSSRSSGGLFSSASNRGVYRTRGYLRESFLDQLDQLGVKYSFIKPQNNYFLQLLLNLAVPVAFLLLMYFFIFRKMGGGGVGGMSIFGNGSKTKAVDEGKVKTRFADVAGVDEAKEELIEVVDFLKEPKKYTDIGGKIPKGVLLVGPPGTGKTLLARAVAGEAGVPFFRISGSDFVEMFVGVGASRVRDLFRAAREKAPCIIFIDELDAIGKSRVNNLGGNDEREQTLNQLLVEMDGFDNEKGLILLAATNRADVLDPALLRPGRFDRQVPVERPDVKGREEILKIHAKNVKLDDDVDFTSIAHGTSGFAGADLANVINEAALLAVRNGRKKVCMVDLNEAIDKVSIGLKKKTRRDNMKERRLVAFHETGHALVGAFTPDYPPVNKITVVPRSRGVGGFTQYREEEERFFRTKKDMLNEIDTCLGGRAAEQIMLGEISTGASNDIQRATDIIHDMITVYGMSDRFKNVTLGKRGGGYAAEPTLVREFSEETQKYIDDEIASMMDERYNYVLNLLGKHKDLLQYVADRLLEIETMDGKEFYEIVNAEKNCVKADDEGEEKSSDKKSPRVKKAAAEKTTDSGKKTVRRTRKAKTEE
ncbi:ATP-dependent zinc metalloprotease FtsH [Treponema sp.]|uniref:ATP-dependent zinc metalloprotease FtsH n=1 Tax=Treponema sp. TaxID=166 RepID=UPI0025EC57D0|nr:ATP-dependent zinc metalloprotease FtsH [Treponema sp.]MCR5219333.1 ATP-dependent zinc metalloprotease FtsH [Treponema sp.]